MNSNNSTHKIINQTNSYRIVNEINNRLEATFSYIYSHYGIFTILCFFLMTAIMVICTPFNEVLRADAYSYLEKAFEIKEGDWTPIHDRSIGWSLFIAFFLKILGIESIYSGMVLSRILSIILMGMCVFPFSGLVKNLIGKKPAIIAVIAFSLSPMLIQIGTIAYTEPLFIFLCLLTVYFLVNADIRSERLIIAASLASLSYYVRPNGILLLVVIVLYGIFLLRDKKISWFFLLSIPCLFFLLSLPHLYLRYEAYGSAFDYGENSKYFVDSYDQVWTSTIPAPTLWEYLSTHSISDYYRKFIQDGLFKIGYHFYQALGEVWAILLVFGIIKYTLLDRIKRLNVIFIVMSIFLVSLIPVYQIHHTLRYFTLLIPFSLIVAAKCLVDLVGENSKSNILILSFLLFLFARIPVAIDQNQLQIAFNTSTLNYPEVKAEWAIWAAKNLQGTVAIIKGRELIKMSARDNTLRDHKNQIESFAEQPPISFIRPGPYENLEKALQDFRELQVSYLLLDTENIKMRPYLKEVYAPQWEKNFTLIQSFKSKPGDHWEIKDMDIFKITY